MYMVGYIVKIHTAQLYNTPTQHENRDIKRNRKLAFIEVVKEGTYIYIGLVFSSYSLTRQTRQKK